MSAAYGASAESLRPRNEPGGPVFREAIQRLPVPPWAVALALFAAHAAIRSGGFRQPALVPLAMVLIWPMPWLLSGREGRRALGIRRAELRWLAVAVPAGIAALAACALAAWAVFGGSESNWFFQHALALGRAAEGIPPQASPTQLFWFLTVPAMIFSPLGEELLFRGYLMRAFGAAFGPAAGMSAQAGAFALVHLAHYGLSPFRPALIPLWLASMFGVALVLGWLAHRSSSLWPAVVAHASFNLAMNAVTFAVFPELL